MTINVWENMTTAVTSTEDAGMTATAMREAGDTTGLMATGKGFMSRRRFTMNRHQRRASVSFSHQSLFVKGSASTWSVICGSYVTYDGLR